MADLALGGQTVLWQETNGGNNLELSISKATLTRPKEREVSYVENGGGAAGDPAGDWTGSLVGHRGLLAYESWKECDRAGGDYARQCSQGRPDLYAQRLHRVGGRLPVFGPDAFFPVWTDGHAILIWHADKTLVLVDSNGRVLWRHSAVPGLVGAVFQGSQLVTLTRSALSMWRLPRNEPVRTFPLAPRRRVLEDLDGGVAVLGSSGTTHLIRLSDGRGATFMHAAHAQLEPQGLIFASGPGFGSSPGRRSALDPELRLSFGNAAADYERGRPGWPDAMACVGGLPAEADVLDLGAGTGKLTRVLARRFVRVTAVEPDPSMLLQLGQVTDCHLALTGSAEVIPLPDAAVDGVFAATASTGSTGRRRSPRSRACSGPAVCSCSASTDRAKGPISPCPTKLGRSRTAIGDPGSSRRGDHRVRGVAGGSRRPGLALRAAPARELRPRARRGSRRRRRANAVHQHLRGSV